jgi:aldose 1-epimerase
LVHKNPSPGIDTDLFGMTCDGQSVHRFTLRNSAGMMVRIIDYGATVTELWVPDRHGRFDDVVLGFDNLRQYETENPYFGSTVGRVAFRITEAEFTLDGKTYHLTRNAGPHHLHGGIRGLSKVVWRAEILPDPKAPAVQFLFRSPDGDQGYPGNLDVALLFKLSSHNELLIDYTAISDRATPVNLTHHGYFNLAGAAVGDVLGHVLQLDADHYTPTDPTMIPTGEIVSVQGTPFDFTEARPIGERLEEVGGYDLSYLRRVGDSSLVRVASLEELLSGRRMEVITTAPAIVLYTGNALDGSLRGKGGMVYKKHAGLCLETGHLPDSVHHDNFPSIILRPGVTYRQTCIYRFLTC